MRLKQIKGKLNRILARIAIFVVVINGTFVSALIPEAKAASDGTDKADEIVATISPIDPAPTVSITSTQYPVTNTSPIAMTATFSEPVTGFTENDLTPTNGTVVLGSFNPSPGGIIYNFNITPTPVYQGPVTVNLLNATGVTDSAGNSYVPAPIDQLSVIYDTTAPDPTYGSKINTGTLTNNPNPIVTGYYSFTVKGISESDVILPDTNKVVVMFDNGSLVYEKEADLDRLNGTYTTDNGNLYTTSVSVLPPGTYKVTAFAKDAAGNLSASELISNALTIDTSAPEAPINLQVTAKTPNSVTLAWTAGVSADTAGYKVSYGTQLGVYTGVRDVGNVTGAEISGLNPTTTYYFIVEAYDGAGNDSIASNAVTAQTTELLSDRSGGSSNATRLSSAGAVKNNPERGGIVESAQAASLQDEQKPEEQKSQTKSKNNLFLWAIIILILGVAGYYYYDMNSEKFKNVKFPKLPGIGGDKQ